MHAFVSVTQRQTLRADTPERLSEGCFQGHSLHPSQLFLLQVFGVKASKYYFLLQCYSLAFNITDNGHVSDSLRKLCSPIQSTCTTPLSPLEPPPGQAVPGCPGSTGCGRRPAGQPSRDAREAVWIAQPRFFTSNPIQTHAASLRLFPLHFQTRTVHPLHEIQLVPGFKKELHSKT